MTLQAGKAPLDTGKLRRALYRYAFNVAARNDAAPQASCRIRLG